MPSPFKHYGFMHYGFMSLLALGCLNLALPSQARETLIDDGHLAAIEVAPRVHNHQLQLQPPTQPWLLAQAQPLLAQGRELYNQGRFREAATLWQQASQAYPAALSPAQQLEQALSLNYLALAYQELNQWEAAHEALDRSLNLLRPLNRGTAAPVLAQTLNTQASLLLQFGQVEQAIDTWQQAQTYYEQVNDLEGSFGSQINQAQALQSLGFYRRSRQELEALGQQLKALPDSTTKISGLRSLGLAHQVSGSLEASEAALLESLATAQRLGLTQEYGAGMLILGRTVLDRGDPDTALFYFQQTEQLSENPLEQLQARLSQLSLYASSGQTGPIFDLADQIYHQLEQLPPSRTTIYGAVNLAANLAQTPITYAPSSTQALVQLLGKAVENAQQIQDPQAEARALHQLGQIYERNTQPEDAISFTEQALALARTLKADDIIAQSAWQLGRLRKQQWQASNQGSTDHYDQAIAAYEEAVNALQALRGDLVAIDSDVQFSFRSGVEPVYRELVSLLLAQEPQQADLAQARELIEALQLAELDNFFREACLDAEPRQIDELDPQATVIYPILLPDRLAVIVSSSGQPLHSYNFPVDQATVEQTLRDYLSALHPVSDKQYRLRLAQQIYDWLISPAEQQQLLQETETLVFVLDGLLRNIPIPALHDGEQYLIERYAVALSPGLQLIAEQTNESESRALVGGISAAQDNFAALPQVETEIATIAQLVPEASTLLNQEFTKPAIAERLQESAPDIVHFATHGQFSSRQEDTFLLTWEDRLSIQELAQLLQNRENSTAQAVELLVLSACETATGDDRAVLGLAGLAIRSGARSTLATLWPVKDQAAALLMTQFYEQLQQSGLTKAEALRQAQLKILQETDFSHPFFWSGFVLVGNWL